MLTGGNAFLSLESGGILKCILEDEYSAFYIQKEVHSLSLRAFLKSGATGALFLA